MVHGGYKGRISCGFGRFSKEIREKSEVSSVSKKKRNFHGTGSYKQIFVRCPFYKRDDGKYRIACEGIVENSSIELTYQFEKLYRMQMDTFCCQHYQKCEIYRMLMEKYE
jgi:hypothetical protein